MKTKLDSTVRFQLEGQHAQPPHTWSVLHGVFYDERLARRAEQEFRDWNEIRPVKGWQDFRVVKVKTTRKIIQKPVAPPDATGPHESQAF